MTLDIMERCPCPKPVGACPRRGDCIACATFHENHDNPSYCMRLECDQLDAERMRHTLRQLREGGFRLVRKGS